MLKDNENLNIAYQYISKTFSHDEIIAILKGSNDLLKPAVLLNLEALYSLEEGSLLLSHLTGVDGKIRESASYKIAELYKEYSQFINTPAFAALLTDALCDVNPNVVRNILELLSYYPQKEIEGLQESIMQRIEEILGEIDKICSKFKRNREKSHALNIKLFNLYWCLEGICCIFNKTICKRLYNILLKCACMYDYTIREKAAKITAKSEQQPEELLSKLSEDVNFYVKSHLCGNI